MKPASQSVGAGDTAVHVIFRTRLGPFEVEVYPHKAPLSAGQFLAFVERGYFNGAAFWRAVRPDNDRDAHPIEVVQACANPEAPPAPPLAHEPTSQTGLHHQDGTLSLGRAGIGTATAAHFFVCIGDQPALDQGGLRNPDGHGFAAFGRVVKGMAVIRMLQQCETDLDGADDISRQVLLRPVQINAAGLGELP